jgi:hypothetical protein
MSDRLHISWPQGRKFAFTVFDDTDLATVDNLKPVYDLLADLGMRTTKSVWVFGKESRGGGMTCQNPEYLKWVLSLQRKGFEVGLHNVGPSTSNRGETDRGLKSFRELFGDQRIVHSNHSGCLENIYWGSARLSGWRKKIYNLVTRGKRRTISWGHIEGNPLFWGDLCQKWVQYVRNFVFDSLNTLVKCPEIPYHDPTKPYVNFWFASTDGSSLRTFVKNFSFSKVDRLVHEGGLCIVYAHFANEFSRNGQIEPTFKKCMEYIASKDGWFVTVSEVLDFLRNGKNPADRIIPPSRLARVETAWLLNKLFTGTT